jgi:hypothetical protein
MKPLSFTILFISVLVAGGMGAPPATAPGTIPDKCTICRRIRGSEEYLDEVFCNYLDCTTECILDVDIPDTDK